MLDCGSREKGGFGKGREDAAGKMLQQWARRATMEAWTTVEVVEWDSWLDWEIYCDRVADRTC